MSFPEVLLWRALRRRPSGLKVRRQHPLGGYVADFAHLSSRTLIEVDGEVHSGERLNIDALRQRDLERLGYAVLRVAARDVLTDVDSVVRMIVASCEARMPLRQPSAGPPPRAGEDPA